MQWQNSESQFERKNRMAPSRMSVE
jgi:hypothetical protein